MHCYITFADNYTKDSNDHKRSKSHFPKFLYKNFMVKKTWDRQHNGLLSKSVLYRLRGVYLE